MFGTNKDGSTPAGMDMMMRTAFGAMGITKEKVEGFAQAFLDHVKAIRDNSERARIASEQTLALTREMHDARYQDEPERNGRGQVHLIEGPDDHGAGHKTGKRRAPIPDAGGRN